MRIKKIIFFSILLITIIYQKANSQNIIGTVVDTSGAPISFANVALLDSKDSSLIIGQNTTDGSFRFENINRDEILLYVSFLGYEPLTQKINLKDKQIVDLGKIALSQSSINLDKVSITAHAPVIDIKNGNVVLNVNTTVLKNEESIIDVIKKAPGIIETNGTLTIFGKGAPVIYVDGKKVVSYDQLSAISPENVKNIEIINNPGAQYEATTNAVINITTDKKKLTLGASLYDNVGYTDYWNNNSMLSIIKNGKKNSQFFSYSFDYGNLEGKEEFKNIIYTIQPPYEYNFNKISRYKGNTHSLFYALDQTIGQKHSIGFQWTGSYNNGEANSNMISNALINQNNVIIKNNLDENSKSNSNFFNLNYSLINDTVNYFKIMTDYAFLDSKSIMNNDQTLNEIKDNYYSEGKNKYSIFSIQSDYEHTFHKIGMKVSMGVKYSNVTNNNYNTFISNTDTSTIIDLFNYKTNLNENNEAAYVNINKSIKKISLSAGLRMENNKWILKEDSVNETTYKDFDFFPNLSFNYNVSDNLDISINYSRKIARVSYASVAQSYLYMNPYMISVGNPFLKPAISDYASLNLNLFQMLYFSFGYVYTKNYNTMAFDNLDSIIMIKYENFNRQQIFGSLYLSIQKEKIFSNIGFAISKSFSEYTYLGNNQKPKGIGYAISTNNVFNIAKNWELSLDAQYMYIGEVDFYSGKGEYNFDFGFRKYFLNKNLRLGLYCTLMSSNQYEAKYNYVYINHKFTSYLYKVYFTIKYNINFKDWDKYSSSIEDEKSRL